MARPKLGYRLADGTPVPGTTSIISRFKDSGALLHWAFGQGKAAQRGEIISLYDKRDEAAEAGTLAHAMVEAHIVLKMGREGEQPELVLYGVDEKIAIQARAAFKAYLSWESMTKLVIVEQEMQLVSEQYQFGGTPDAIGQINGELCLVDWKTSNGVYQDYLIQLAAYKHLWEEKYPDRPLTGGYHLCRFAKEHGDFAHHFYPNLDEAWEAFVLMRRLYDLDKQLKKRA